MPNFEYEFSNTDRQLVVSPSEGTVFGNNLTDYIRITIYPTEAIGNIVTLPGTDNQAIFYSSLNTNTFQINISPFGIGTDTFETRNVGGDENDFKIYKNGDNVYIKPNEIFNTYGLPQGDYKVQIDFLNQVKSDYQFIIKQVSTSRKEVRLKLINQFITKNSTVISELTNTFNTDSNDIVKDKYQFKHILNIGTGDHNPIMNYQFDAVTDGKDNQSIILKLYEPLPTNVGNLSMVTIEREVLTTQIQDIFYFSDVPDVYFGDGLITDFSYNDINPDGNEVEFQNYNELSASIDDITLDNIISSSDNYPNLNTDFKFFENHTFFGSAKRKLENFKTKVETIQGHYSDISSSLSGSGIAIGGDANHVVQKRKNLFKKINNEIKTFTPYERFLYYDGQSESTASAPGLGKNYANSTPVTTNVNEYEGLNGYDGFDVVHNHSNKNMTTDQGQFVDVFSNKYYVHQKPFFNYSSSIYLSFILKGDESIEHDGTSGLHWQNSNDNLSINGLGVDLPAAAFGGTTKLQNPSITGSEYRRHIYVTSQSYWIPFNGWSDDIAHITDFGSISSQISLLTGGTKTGSYRILDSTNKYPTTVVSSSSGIPFYGSVMPAGELFRIFFDSGSQVTSSFISDVKISLKNPTNVLPFDNLYHTSSADWTNWYNTMYTNAEAFDTINIHSLENNLPLYIQESSDYNEMKDFLALQGEQYDLIRNHIDSMGTLHDRGYKKTDSPPDNTLPMLLNNIGWETINPFSGSLTDTLGSYLTNVTSIDDIKNQTWKKTLNNLLYIYKSKGTKNSIRGLLNTYGYPPDVLEFQEFGGSTQNNTSTDNVNPVFSDSPPPATRGNQNDLNLTISTGSIGFTKKKQKLHRYIVGNNSDRIFNLDWWMDDADLNTFEFIYKHKHTTNTQTILKSSGSGAETLWDLRLVPSTLGESSSFEFRLNSSQTGSSAIAGNRFRMSSAYSSMTDGQLWNVMLQRMTGSISGSGTNEYRLHSALQDDVKIQTYNYVAMSVSGGLAGGSTLGGLGFYANQNWPSSGSRHADSSSNLFVGESVSGSLTEIRGWSSALSISRFRQHTLNKLSTVGNTINSHKNELIYNFKLNENYLSSSVSSSAQNLKIVDSAPTTIYSDYSFTKSGTTFNTSSVYGFDYIDIINLSTTDNTLYKNDNNILINPKESIIGNLNPNIPAVVSLTNPLGKKPQFKTSDKLELYRSPQNFVNDYILNNIGGFNLEKLYGNPLNYYSQSYSEFDTFKEKFFDAHPITIDTNKFIRAHENMFNHSITEGMKKLIPARSTFSGRNSNMGVEIKPTILEKQKTQGESGSIEINPNVFTSSISVVSVESIMTGSSIDLPISGSVRRGYNPFGIPSVESSFIIPSTSGSKLELPYSASIKISDSGSTNTLTQITSLVINPYTGSLSIITSKLMTGSIVIFPKSGSIDYSSHANKSFVNIHDSWNSASSGAGLNSTHFINYGGGTSSYGNFNTYHIDSRYHFVSIGDEEIYSGSNGDFTDFSNYSRLHNRTIISDGIHADSTYESYINGNPGNRTGRMMGKTRYFFTGSDGNIILPTNHINRFSNPFKEQMINGTQNTNPGILNVEYEDYSSASFYRVNVTGGENQITVKTPNTRIDSNDNIIY